MNKRLARRLAFAAACGVLTVMSVPAQARPSVTDEIRALEQHKHAPAIKPAPARTLRLSNGQTVNAAHWNIVLFMASDCSYCKRFDPVLRQVSEETGVGVFPYTLNGEADASFPHAVPAPPTVVAAFFAQGLPIATPTTFLVNVDTMDTFPLLQGDATAQQLQDRLDTVLIEALKRLNRKGIAP